MVIKVYKLNINITHDNVVMGAGRNGAIWNFEDLLDGMHECGSAKDFITHNNHFTRGAEHEKHVEYTKSATGTSP